MKNQLKVIKIGGEIIDDETKLDEAIENFASIKGEKILVHGGGKLATDLSRKLGIETNMHNGRRITTEKEIEIVTMVYAGLLNKKIAAKLQALGCNALGLSGADANTIACNKRVIQEIDYGLVGDVRLVNRQIIDTFLKNGLTPVFCAITHDEKGQLLNTNADTIASEVAVAMSNFYDTELIFCFDKKGVLRDIQNPDSVIAVIDSNLYTELKKNGVINAGMLPKLKKGFDALKHNVSRVVIGDTGAINNDEVLCTTLKL